MSSRSVSGIVLCGLMLATACRGEVEVNEGRRGLGSVQPWLDELGQSERRPSRERVERTPRGAWALVRFGDDVADLDERYAQPIEITERTASAPAVWADLAVWVDTVGPRDTARAPKLACQQLHLGGWSGACRVITHVGVRRVSASEGVVEYARPTKTLARPRGQARPAPSARCSAYAHCVARHAWLGRRAPWNDDLPEWFATEQMNSIIHNGAAHAVTEEWALGLLAHTESAMTSADDLERWLERKLIASEEIAPKRNARQWAYAQWLLQVRPWEDWTAFVSSALRRPGHDPVSMFPTTPELHREVPR
jgi:hypothetical protein